MHTILENQSPDNCISCLLHLFDVFVTVNILIIETCLIYKCPSWPIKKFLSKILAKKNARKTTLPLKWSFYFLAYSKTLNAILLDVSYMGLRILKCVTCTVCLYKSLQQIGRPDVWWSWQLCHCQDQIWSILRSAMRCRRCVLGLMYSANLKLNSRNLAQWSEAVVIDVLWGESVN